MAVLGANACYHGCYAAGITEQVLQEFTVQKQEQQT